MELNKYEFRVAYAKTYGRNFGVIGSGVIESYISPYDFTGRLEALEEKNNWNFLYGIAVMGIIALVITNVLLIRSILRERLILQSPQTNIIPVKISPQSLIAVQEKIYTVISGDDLWHIAEKFYASGYHWIIIARENNLKNPGLLIIGQKLFIPAITNQMRTKVIEGKYIVQKGDDLWGIAVLVYQNGYKWVEIAHANHIHNPGLIYPGEILHIPKD